MKNPKLEYHRKPKGCTYFTDELSIGVQVRQAVIALETTASGGYVIDQRQGKNPVPPVMVHGDVVLPLGQLRAVGVVYQRQVAEFRGFPAERPGKCIQSPR